MFSCDVLINLLVLELHRMDGIKSTTKVVFTKLKIFQTIKAYYMSEFSFLSR